MKKKSARTIFESLNEEQKQLFEDMVQNAIMRTRMNDENDEYGIKLSDECFMTARYTYEDGHDRVRVRAKGSFIRMAECITALSEMMIDRTDYDFEDVVTAMRYIHYSNIVKNEDDWLDDEEE